MITWVFFDAGETLLSPNPSWSELSARVLAGRGHDVDTPALMRAWREVGGHFRRASENGTQFSLTTEDSEEFWTSLYADIVAYLGLTDDGAPKVLYETFSDPANYRLFPDARGCLEALRSMGLNLGIISNFESWLGNLLKALEVDEFFSVITISGEVGIEKPDGRIFDLALERSGAAPAECVYIGDQPYFDAEPAEKLGWTGILIDRFDRWGEEPFRRVRTLEDIPALVQELARR